MITIEHRNRLDSLMRDFLWDQWVALGLAGHASGRPIPFVIDPEALLLASLRFAFDEGRFRGEVGDWLSRNGDLVSVQRIKNLDRALQLTSRDSLRGLAVFMQAKGFPNWKSLAAGETGAGVFPETDGRGLSQAPDPKRPEVFLLRMRLLFGVSARPEVITWLLTHREGHAARIARETGWFSKSVQAILNDLEQAGFLTSRSEGKRKEFSVHPRASIWHPELGANLGWFGQSMFYLGVHHLMAALDSAADRSSSASVRAIAIRRNLVPLEDALRQAGLDGLFSGAQREKGENLVRRFEEGASALSELLETREGF